MATREICPTCDTNPVRIKGECKVCNEYRRRNGRARPARLAARQAELNRRRFEDRLTPRR